MMTCFEAKTLRDAIITRDSKGDPAPVEMELNTYKHRDILVGKMESRGLIIIDRWEREGETIKIVYRLSA